MKILVASDLHGSLFYLKKLMKQVEIEKPDYIYFLGDILYHGPRNDLPKDYNPKEVIKLLNNYSGTIFAVRGNCDTEVDQMVLNFPLLAPYSMVLVDDISIFMTHGHLYNQNNLPNCSKGSYIMCGHTHIQAFEKFDDFTYINVGSVSIPKDNGYHGYVIIENKKIIFKDLEGVIKDIHNLA